MKPKLSSKYIALFCLLFDKKKNDMANIFEFYIL